MINTGQPEFVLPMVDWQGEKAKPYKLFRLEELRGTAPQDGHYPKTPHRIGFHAMMLVTEGSFEHGLDFQTHRFSKNQLVYIAPNQVHHFVKDKRAHKAYILAFRPEILPADYCSWTKSEFHGQSCAIDGRASQDSRQKRRSF